MFLSNLCCLGIYLFGCRQPVCGQERAAPLQDIMNRLKNLENHNVVLSHQVVVLSQQVFDLKRENVVLKSQIDLLAYNSELDSYAYSKWYLNDSVCNIFLFIKGSQPHYRGPHLYFQNQLSNSNVNFARLLDELSIPACQKEQFSIDADSTIDHRNNAVHFDNAKQLKEAVCIAAGMFTRHPTLHLEYPFHHFVISHFYIFEKVYPMSFKSQV